jgi:hypothetical protein
VRPGSCRQRREAKTSDHSRRPFYSLFHLGRRLFLVFKMYTFHGEQICLRRSRAVHCPRDVAQFGGTHGVSEGSVGRGCGGDGFQVQLPHRLPLSRVDENSDPAPTERLGKLGSQLVTDDNLYTFHRFLDQTLCNPPAEAVILPKGIAVTDDQNGAGHVLLRTAVHVEGEAPAEPFGTHRQVRPPNGQPIRLPPHLIQNLAVG